METTMYEEGRTNALNGNMKQMKSKMTLDFNSQAKPKKLNGLLASPDLNICTLASPELERIIIQQNGMVTTTPTPTQFLFPKSVTEEQEAYARGFVDALAELHHQGGDETKDSNSDSSSDSTMSMTTLQPVQHINHNTNAVSVAQSHHLTVVPSSGYSFSTTTSLPDTVMQTNSVPMPTVVTAQQVDLSSTSSRTSSPLLQAPVPVGVSRVLIKEEPQTVPCYNTPPMSPVNMVQQERIKLDRKRARNRVAARKCRYRKLERISKLEDRIQDLCGQKNDLASNASQLREQVARLKQQIMEHVDSGCKVMLNTNLL